VEKGLKLVLSFTSDRDQLAAALATLALPPLISPTSDPLALTVFDPSSLASLPGMGTTATAGQTMGDTEWADILSTYAMRQERAFDAYVSGRVVALAKELAFLARTLNSIHGRKNIVYFSEGFDSKLLSGITGEASGKAEGELIITGQTWKVSTEDRYGRSEVRKALDETFQIFKRTDNVIYPLDVSGLSALAASSVEGSSSTDRGASTARLGSRGRGLDSLYIFASETGGQLFKNSNDLGEHLEKLQEETALVYLMSYSPAVLKEPGRYHSLKVKVKASGAQVSSRAGYFEPRPWSTLTPGERRLLAAQQIVYGLPRTDIPVRAVAAPLLGSDGAAARVPIILEIPGGPLVKQAAGETLNLEIFAYATTSKLKTKGYLSQAIRLDLKRVGTRLASSGIKYYGEMALAPGTYWLRVLVRIAETGRSGLLIVPITVPPPENRQLFAVGPIFHDAPGKWLMVKAPAKAGAPPPPPYPFVSRGESYIPTADPVLEASGESRLSLLVFNAADGVDLDVRGEIRGKGGVRLGPAALSRVASTRDAGGPLNLLCSFRPGDLEKGSYTLWVGVKDRATGAEAETLGMFEMR
jgi:VWFA-related protein